MNFPCAKPGYGSCPYPDQNCCRLGRQVGFKSINIDYFLFKDPLFFFYRKPGFNVKPTVSRSSDARQFSKTYSYSNKGSP